MKNYQKVRLIQLIKDLRAFRFCGPSDDPDEQTGVTAGYRYLVVQLKRLACPILPEPDAARLNAIEVEINNLFSAYEAHDEVDALLPDIEAIVEGVEASIEVNS